jgi:hypothetical protein
MRLDKNGVILSDDEDVEVDRTEPQLDECKMILLHLVRQAIDDYQLFVGKTKPEHQEIFLSASGFLFDADYLIQWGDIELSLEQICDVINLDLEWVRSKITHQIGVKLKQPEGIVKPIRIVNVQK